MDRIKQLEDELTAARNDMQFFKMQALDLQRQIDAASTGAPVTATSEIIRQLQTLYNDIAAADALAQARDARIAQLEAELATQESATGKALWDRIATLTQANQSASDVNDQLHALAQARDERIAQLETELATLTQTNQYEADINKQLLAQMQAHGQRATVERKRADQLRLELAQAHRTIEGLRTENAKLWRRLNTREHGNE